MVKQAVSIKVGCKTYNVSNSWNSLFLCGKEELRTLTAFSVFEQLQKDKYKDLVEVRLISHDPVKYEDDIAKDFDATLINPIYMTGIDEELLEELKENHNLVITLEDGVLDGGFGEKIARFYGNSNVKVLNYGAKKEFTDRVPLNELYNKYRLTKELILEDIIKYN